MSEKQLKELGHRLTRLKITFSIREWTHFVYGNGYKYININLFEIKNFYNSHLKLRGYTQDYLNLQSILHEVAHFKQFLKYGEGREATYNCWKYLNGERGERVADRFALMYYRRFVGNAIYT